MQVFGCDTYQAYFSDMLFKYDSPNDVVVQHNKFVEGRYIFSINELRIFMYMLLKVDKHDTEFKEIKIPCHILHSEEKRVNYTQISKACKSLVKKVIEIESTTIKGKRKHSGIPLMARLDYEEGGYIIAKFNDEAKAYLLGLTQNFTKTHFKMFMSIKTF